MTVIMAVRVSMDLREFAVIVGVVACIGLSLGLVIGLALRRWGRE